MSGLAPAQDWTPCLTMSRLAGFSMFLPGIAVVHLGGTGLQPVICAFAGYLLLRLWLRAQVPGSILVWILAGLLAGGLATLFSLAPAYSLKYLMLQSVYLCVVGLASAWMLLDPRDRGGFLNGFLAGAGASSLFALLQVGLSRSIGFYPSVTNNQNFSLISPSDRGVAFTPEASILATLLIPATVIAYMAWRRRWHSAWPPFANGAFLCLLLAGLLATRSSSLFLLPLLLVGYELLAARDPRSLLRRGSAALLGAAVLLLVFLPYYQARLERADAQFSTLGRAEKLMAGIRIFKQYPLEGAGLGMVSEPAFFDPYVVQLADWSWQQSSSRKGIDSTALRTAAESGLLGLLALYYPVLLALGVAKRALANPEYGPLGVLAFSLLLSQALVTGYRDLPFMFLPMAVFLLAPAFVPRQAAAPAFNVGGAPMSIWRDNRAHSWDEEQTEGETRPFPEPLSVEKAIALDTFRYRLEFFRDRVERQAGVLGPAMPRSARARRRGLSKHQGWLLTGSALVLLLAAIGFSLFDRHPDSEAPTAVAQGAAPEALGHYEGNLALRFISHDQLFQPASKAARP